MINSLNNLIAKYIAGVGKVALLKSKNNKIKLCILYHGVGITRMHKHKHVLQKANTVEADPDNLYIYQQPQVNAYIMRLLVFVHEFKHRTCSSCSQMCWF